MAFKAILIVCSALLVNAIAGQCIGSALNAGCGGNGLAGYGAGIGLTGNNLAGCNAGNGLAGNGYAINLGNLASLSGGELPVSSSSALAPSGLSVVSENALEGVLSVYGALPFLSAVALEGQVPSGGSAGVSYSCGNGNVGILGVNGGAGASGLSLGSAGLASGLNYGNTGLANAGLANCGLANVGVGSCGLANAGIGTGCGGLYF